uniref:Nucleolar complex protein 2 n=1 Tax=Oxyrrhis marina TaxID=2969 RepID=A0A7S4GPP2_OXYMA
MAKIGKKAKRFRKHVKKNGVKMAHQANATRVRKLQFEIQSNKEKAKELQQPKMTVDEGSDFDEPEDFLATGFVGEKQGEAIVSEELDEIAVPADLSLTSFSAGDAGLVKFVQANAEAVLGSSESAGSQPCTITPKLWAALREADGTIPVLAVHAAVYQAALRALGHAGAGGRVFEVPAEVAAEVVAWCGANTGALLQHHGTEAAEPSAKKRKGKKAVPEDASNPVARYLAHQYLAPAVAALGAAEVQNLVPIVRMVGDVDMLALVAEFPKLRARILRHVSNLWCRGKAREVQLEAYVVLRNAAAAWHLGKKDGLTPVLEAMYTTHAEAANTRYCWRTVSDFRFLERGLVDLLRTDAGTAYSFASSRIRQLGLVLRNSLLHKSRGKEVVVDRKLAGQKPLLTAAKKAIGSWGVLRSLAVWTTAVTTVPHLKTLGHALALTIGGVLKAHVGSLETFPIVRHCMVMLADLGAGLERLVPVTSYALQVICTASQAMDRLKKGGNLNSTVETTQQDMMMMLRLPAEDLEEIAGLDNIARAAAAVLGDHYGTICRSPSFPELVEPVLLVLGREAKRCVSEPTRRDLRQLCSLIHSSVTICKTKRMAMGQVPDPGVFLVFREKEMPLAKARLSHRAQRLKDEPVWAKAEAAKALERRQQADELHKELRDKEKRKLQRAARKQRDDVKEMDLSEDSDSDDVTAAAPVPRPTPRAPAKAPGGPPSPQPAGQASEGSTKRDAVEKPPAARAESSEEEEEEVNEADLAEAESDSDDDVKAESYDGEDEIDDDLGSSEG